MVNVEALLSPTGGYDYEQTINSGVAGLVGTFLFDKTVFSKYLHPHAGRYYMQKMSPAGAAYHKAKAGIQSKFKKGLEGIEKKFSDPKFTSKIGSPKSQIGFNKPKPVLTADQIKNKAIEKAKLAQKSQLDAARKTFMGRDKAAEKSFFKGLKGGRTLFRGIGITMLLSAGLDLAEAAFTPGISKVSAQKEQQFMAGGSTALDSQASYTMRQRAVMAIHDSMMNVRQVIGNEAQFMHR